MIIIKVVMMIISSYNINYKDTANSYLAQIKYNFIYSNENT